MFMVHCSFTKLRPACTTSYQHVTCYVRLDASNNCNKTFLEVLLEKQVTPVACLSIPCTRKETDFFKIMFLYVSVIKNQE